MSENCSVAGEEEGSRFRQGHPLFIDQKKKKKSGADSVIQGQTLQKALHT